ncbi:MAG TPA: signal peptide prediction [Burkholderiales bacterium]
MLHYLWASPASAVGLTVLLMARVCGASVRMLDGTLEVGGGRIGAAIDRLPACLRFNAITFGHVIIGVDDALLAACRAHERVHVRQYERWGIFFFPLYLGSSLLQLVRGRSPYWDNHFERQAYATETRQPTAPCAPTTDAH